MHHDAIEVDDRPHGVETACPAGPNASASRSCSDLRDQRRRNITPYSSLTIFLNVAGRHSLGIQSQDLFIEAGESAIILPINCGSNEL